MGVVIQRILDVMTEEVRVDDEARHGIDGDGLRRHPLRRRFGCVLSLLLLLLFRVRERRCRSGAPLLCFDKTGGKERQKKKKGRNNTTKKTVGME